MWRELLAVVFGRRRVARLSWTQPSTATSPTGTGAPQQFIDWVKSPLFFESREWRVLRYQVLVRAGGRCECCGQRSSPDVRLNVDHIKPRSRFPHLALKLDNLQCLCEACNVGKGAWDATDWRNRAALERPKLPSQLRLIR